MGIFTKQGNQEGSCLIELLLVLVIVGIFLSIGFPVYSIIIRRTEEVVCRTHSSHLSTIAHHDSHVPPEKALGDYLNQSRQYRCPSGGFYIYSGRRVGCNIHDEIEDRVVCAYSRQVLEEDYYRYLESVPEHHPFMTWTEFLESAQNICPSSGVIGYNSGIVVCSLHPGGHDGDGDDNDDDGSAPFL